MLNSSDHDILILVHAKIEEIIREMRGIRDRFDIRIEGVESRVLILEKLIDEINPYKIVKMVTECDEFVKEYKIKTQFSQSILKSVPSTIWVLFGAFLMYLITQWNTIVNLFK
ncbi:MAG: hypothetical protein AABY22_03490 [Nanoarchaeota archaeon]